MGRRYLLASLILLLLDGGCKEAGDKGSVKATAVPPPKAAPPHPSHYVSGPEQRTVFVFVHGILGDSNSTWRASNDAYFPKLLATDPDLPARDVYVYDFPTRLTSQGPFSIPEIAADMNSRLKRDEIFELHDKVIFIAHSMGGLVVEQFLLTYRDLASKVPFIALYSTPQTGSEIARLGSVFSRSRQIDAMLPGEDNQYLENLERQWKNSRFQTLILCAYERRPTKGVVVVGRDSATRLCGGDTVPVDADHIALVKPPDREDSSYIALYNWVKDHRKTAAPTEGHVYMTTPRAMDLSKLVGILQEKENVTIAFENCSEEVRTAEVPRGSYSGADMKDLLERIRLRIESSEVQYTVHTVREGVRYEIRCA